MMKVFLLTLLCGVALSEPVARRPKADVAGQGYCTVNTSDGVWETTFKYYQSQLTSPFDNTICSATISGLWIFYGEYEYNKYNSNGYFYLAYGQDYTFTLPVCDVTSSLKYANNRYYFNEDAYTIYEGANFAGDEFYGNIPTDSMDFLNRQGSSIIITGTTGWTFYTDLNGNGEAHCFMPTFTNNGVNYGIYDDLSTLTDQNGNLANVDNLFMSVRQGCLVGAKVHQPSKMVTIEKSANGGVAYIEKKL